MKPSFSFRRFSLGTQFVAPLFREGPAGREKGRRARDFLTQAAALDDLREVG